MDTKILLFGNRSFVATGLYEKLERANFKVDCFSRGDSERNGFQVSGDVHQISTNPFLDSTYDIVINFIVLKNCSLQENLQYAEELINFCRKKSVKKIIQISSIMVYNNNELVVNENTLIEESTNKSGYGAIKIEVDRYLQSINNIPFTISFIRPGYVIAEDRSVPYLKILPFDFAIIKGNNKSVQPIINRDDLQNAITTMLKEEIEGKVFLFVPSDKKTKYNYVKDKYNYRCFFLNKRLIMGITSMLMTVGIISKSFFTRVEGMYIETQYDSSKTEMLLSVKF
jgi:nucleoside-diphosphate-sugar epimerase